MNRHCRVLLLAFALSSGLSAQEAIDAASLTGLPAREAFLFKDGHAFMIHEGQVEMDPKGSVWLSDLPKPVLGTFWPSILEEGLSIDAVVASRRKIRVQKAITAMSDLILANPGARVTVREFDGVPFDCELVANDALGLNERASFVLLRTLEGVKSLPIERIRDLTFRGDYKTRIAVEETREVLEVRLKGADLVAGRKVRLGFAYLQKGLQWIPSWKVDIDGKGKAKLALQAGIVNDLMPLEGATLQFVIGVPTFEFASMRDPIALESIMQQSFAAVPTQSVASNFLANSIRAQVADYGESAEGTLEGGDARFVGAGGLEDLFVYTVTGVTLAKGERMNRLVNEFDLDYEDVYVLEIPVAPPEEIQAAYFNGDTREAERLAREPKAVHKIRLVNGSRFPLTTAPALIFREGRVVAQGMMKYTPAGAKGDLALTTAIDLEVVCTEVETGRQNKVLQLNKSDFNRVDLHGKICITNRTGKAAKIEVVRHVMGSVGSVNREGRAVAVSLASVASTAAGPSWWSSYRMPRWWTQVNGISKIVWGATIEPAQSVDFEVDWYYLWN